MVRVFRKDLFLTALLLAIIIFGGGFFLGSLWDSFRLDYSNKLLQESSLDTQSFLVEQEFVSTFGGEYSSARLLDINRRIGKLGELLVEFDAKKMSHGSEYDNLKQQYFTLELKAYMLRHEKGGDDNVILFFYDVEDNEDSLRQGDVLDALVRSDESVVVFSFHRGFDDPLVDTLKEYYGVVDSPTVVVNYDNVFKGFVSVAELKESLK